MIPIFSNVTEDAFSLLQEILKHPNHPPADFFFSEPTVDGQLELLIASKLVSINESSKLNITELGRSALKAYEQEKEHQLLLEKQRKKEFDSLKIIAKSSQIQTKLAEDATQRAIADTKNAKRDALFAKVVSIIAIIAPILYNFITEKLPILLQVLQEQSTK